jgi:UDP-N-acetylglucosamine 2-epimerase
VLVVVASLVDHVRAAALMAALAERVGTLTIKLVRVRDDDALALSGVLFDGLDLKQGVIALGCTETKKEALGAELAGKFKQVLERVSTRAVVVLNAGEEALACAAVARSLGVSVVHVGTGLPVDDPRIARAGGHAPTGGLADLWYPTDERAIRMIACKGVPLARIHCVGDLLGDAVQIALRALRDPMRTGAFHRMVIPRSSEEGRYALVLIEEPKHVSDRQSVVALLAFLRRISRSVPLVLLLRPEAEREFDKQRLHPEIFGDRVCHLHAQAYTNQVELLRNATCVLTDSPDVRQEAIALDTPCLAIGVRPGSAVPGQGRTVTTGGEAQAGAWAAWPYGDDAGLPERRDGLVGDRIAEHLGAKLKHSISPSSPPVL